MDAKIWAALFGEAVVFGVLLFGAAGTVRWPQGWAFLIVFFIPAAIVSLRVARDDPALMRERMALPMQKGQPVWDKIVMGAIALLFILWIALMGYDGGRLHRGAMPVWLEALGALGIVVMFVLADWVMHANTYLAPVVRVQVERGHQAVTTGPYAIVRHPLYAAAVILFFAAPLLLGSWYGELGALALTAILTLRTALEDRLLQRSLDGYATYAATVRWRLVPGIW
ncbi:MAG TPA: isoprenylcysteine carboxylmethyltransferase family protein [Rhizomicrobium sp.]|jgi:protein-S-isoprenylcysteine O-methyltransferase Ste14|nr:isoprenylcysteine carboxylmethyltransferase family protein [Rhizomicrobium sp.]